MIKAMLFGLKQNTILSINSIFESHSSINEVIIYGSRAKGSNKPASDIDLTVKGDSIPMSLLNKISTELDDLLLPYTIDLSIYQHIENQELLNHIQRVGKVFYQKHP